MFTAALLADTVFRIARYAYAFFAHGLLFLIAECLTDPYLWSSLILTVLYCILGCFEKKFHGTRIFFRAAMLYLIIGVLVIFHIPIMPIISWAGTVITVSAVGLWLLVALGITVTDTIVILKEILYDRTT